MKISSSVKFLGALSVVAICLTGYVPLSSAATKTLGSIPSTPASSVKPSKTFADGVLSAVAKNSSLTKAFMSEHFAPKWLACFKKSQNDCTDGFVFYGVTLNNYAGFFRGYFTVDASGIHSKSRIDLSKAFIAPDQTSKKIAVCNKSVYRSTESYLLLDEMTGKAQFIYKGFKTKDTSSFVVTHIDLVSGTVTECGNPHQMSSTN